MRIICGIHIKNHICQLENLICETFLNITPFLNYFISTRSWTLYLHHYITIVLNAKIHCTNSCIVSFGILEYPHASNWSISSWLFLCHYAFLFLQEVVYACTHPDYMWNWMVSKLDKINTALLVVIHYSICKHWPDLGLFVHPSFLWQPSSNHCARRSIYSTYSSCVHALYICT